MFTGLQSMSGARPGESLPISAPIKVLFYLFFPSGGIGKYTHQLLQELAGRDDLDIEVVCLPNFQWKDNPHYRTWPGLFGISHRWPIVRKARFLLAQFINPVRLIRRAREVNADIVHVCNINHLSFPFWRRRLDDWRGKVVCTAHDVRRSRAIVNRGWEERNLGRFYRRCDALFVHGRDQARDLVEFADVDDERIYVVPHGPTGFGRQSGCSRSELRSRYGIPQECVLGLFFGFIRPDKNLQGLLKALAEVKDDRLHLLVAGNVAARGDAYLQACRRLVASLGLEGHVHWQVRYIPDSEVTDLLKLCDWVAQTYARSFTSHSGVLNLAAHYHRPVLATPTISFTEMLQDVDIGILCDGFEQADIANGIRRMQARLEKDADWAFEEYQDRYSWARNADTTQSVYRQLVAAA